jgi:hypothetical protein
MFTKAGLMSKLLVLQARIYYGCCDQEAKTISFLRPQGMAGTYHALALHSNFIGQVMMLNLLQLLCCTRRSTTWPTFPPESCKAHWLLI